MSDLYQSLSHSKWDCKYHVVFVPKRRRKAIFGQTRRHLGPIFHVLARDDWRFGKPCEVNLRVFVLFLVLAAHNTLRSRQ